MTGHGFQGFRLPQRLGLAEQVGGFQLQQRFQGHAVLGLQALRHGLTIAGQGIERLVGDAVLQNPRVQHTQQGIATAQMMIQEGQRPIRGIGFQPHRPAAIAARIAPGRKARPAPAVRAMRRCPGESRSPCPAPARLRPRPPASGRGHARRIPGRHSANVPRGNPQARPRPYRSGSHGPTAKTR